MKKAIGLAVLTLFVGSTTAMAQGLSGSAHDFSAAAWNSGGYGDEMCIVCHAPHNNLNTTDLLWNHDASTATYSMYTSTTLNGAIAAGTAVASVSKTCLSCHDGTVALDSYGGKSGSTFIAARGNFGIDLRNDHPISIQYDATSAGADGELVDPSTDGDTDPSTVGAAAPYLPLYQDGATYQVECATCHDVHNKTTELYMLYKTNSGSALCTTCHQK